MYPRISLMRNATDKQQKELAKRLWWGHISAQMAAQLLDIFSACVSNKVYYEGLFGTITAFCERVAAVNR